MWKMDSFSVVGADSDRSCWIFFSAWTCETTLVITGCSILGEAALGFLISIKRHAAKSCGEDTIASKSAATLVIPEMENASRDEENA